MARPGRITTLNIPHKSALSDLSSHLLLSSKLSPMSLSGYICLFHLLIQLMGSCSPADPGVTAAIPRLCTVIGCHHPKLRRGFGQDPEGLIPFLSQNLPHGHPASVGQETGHRDSLWDFRQVLPPPLSLYLKVRILLLGCHHIRMLGSLIKCLQSDFESCR